MANSLGHYRDIIVVLAQKDFKVRYRNSVLGFIWSLLNPLAYMTILTLVFSFLLRVSVRNFAAWVLIGLLIWRFFSIATSQSLFSIVVNPGQHQLPALSDNAVIVSSVVIFPLLGFLIFRQLERAPRARHLQLGRSCLIG